MFFVGRPDVVKTNLWRARAFQFILSRKLLIVPTYFNKTPIIYDLFLTIPRLSYKSLVNST